MNPKSSKRGFGMVLVFLLVFAGLIISLGGVSASTTILVDNLQPDFNAVGGGGVYSAYYGPDNGYSPTSPGNTALIDGREAGKIKAGLLVDPTSNHYEDEGLFAFIPGITINEFASGLLNYEVENQEGNNPVWMTIELDTGVVGNRADNVVYQFVPSSNPSGWHTVDASSGLWQKWNDNNGNVSGNPLVSLSNVSSTYSGINVIRAYLRLGMGDSYHGSGLGTVAWVDKVDIGDTTYDFVVPSYWYVSSTGFDTNEGTLASPFLTIQKAINSANSGDTINVMAGAYSGDLTINKSLVLNGDNKNSIIEGKVSITSSNINFTNFKVTNPTGIVGISLPAGGSVQGNVYIKNNLIQDIGTTGPVNGYNKGISVEQGSNVNILDNNITGISSQSVGATHYSSMGVVIGDGSDATKNGVTISGNTISNVYYAGPYDWTSTVKSGGAYGIQISRATSGLSISQNTISNVEGYWAHAIGLEADTPDAVVSGNVVSGIVDHKSPTNVDAVGLRIEDNPSAETLTIYKNSFPYGQNFYGVSNVMSGEVNATYNYWGVKSPNFTAIVDGNVSYSPWFVDSAMTQTLSTTVGENQTVADNEIVEVGNETNEVVIPAGSPVKNISINSSIPSDKKINISLTELKDSDGNVTLGSNDFVLKRETSVSNYSAEIPAGTVISGGSSWDGKISLPTLTLTSLNSVSSGSVEVVVDLGSNTRVNFSKAVKVVIGGQAGKSAAWASGDGTMTQITTKCNSATDYSNIIGNGECYADSGSDLIIWTYHFTRFAAYTPIAVAATTTSGGGGGACTTNWECSAWSICSADGTQTRTCSYPTNYCTPGSAKPVETQSCTPTISNNGNANQEANTPSGNGITGFSIFGEGGSLNSRGWGLLVILLVLVAGFFYNNKKNNKTKGVAEAKDSEEEAVEEKSKKKTKSKKKK